MNGGIRPARKLLLLLAASVALGGCVASVAAGALGAAVRSGQKGDGTFQADEAVKLAAASACRAQAGQYGDVHVIDIEPRSATKVTVWGTVTSATERRSFECRYDRKVVSFKLRNI